MKKYILVVLASIFLASCHDLLDIRPEGQVSLDEVFSDEVMIGAYVNTCYKGIPPYGNSWSYATNVPIIYSDDAHEYGTTSTSAVLGYEGYSVDSQYSTGEKTGAMWGGKYWDDWTSWSYFYTYIYNCNVYMSRIESAKDVMSPQKYAQWTTEVRLLRAYMYYELISRYGDVAFILEPCSIGDVGADLVKTSFHTIADYIIAECDYALTDESQLPWRYETSNPARMTKAIAATLRSRVATYAASPLFMDEDYVMEDGKKHDWDWAYGITSTSLEKCLANGYEIYTSSVDYPSPDEDNYPEHFSMYSGNPYYSYYMLKADYSKSPTDKETIMVSRTQIRSDFLYQGPPLLGGYKAGWCPTQELVDAYPMTNGDYVVDLVNPYEYAADDQSVTVNFAEGSSYNEQDPYINRDPRFYATIMFNGSDIVDSKNTPLHVETFIGGNDETLWAEQRHTPTGYYARKYWEPDTEKNSTAKKEFRLMSLGELYLNNAEAAVESGRYAEAEDAIRPLRDRVSMPNIVLQGQDQDIARARVRNERRIELALQEYRYNDTRRWTPADEDMKCNRILTAMWIIKKDDGTYEYHRLPIGQSMDKDGNVTGKTLVRAIGENKYLLHALRTNEVNKILLATGDNWQNPGW